MFGVRRMGAAGLAAPWRTVMPTGVRCWSRVMGAGLAVVVALLPLVGWTQTPPGPPPVAPGAPSDERRPEQSPLKRKDVPPEGIAAQLIVSPPAKPPPPRPPPSPGRAAPRCPLDLEDAPEPRAGMPPDPNEIGTTFYVCFGGLEPDQDVDVEVTWPNGVVQWTRDHTDDRGMVAWGWIALPGEPLGVYVVSATQGPRRATGTFAVRAASRPRILVLPEVGSPGSIFRVYLAGFEPHRFVPLYLYRDSTYATELPSAAMNDRGEAIRDLRTEPDDPVASYLVRTGAPEGIDDRFRLES
jgi:hypothetical protein